MSYIPTEWKTGDIVTAEKLNKLEEGVASGGGGGGGLLVHIMSTELPPTLDKNWNEINAAVQAGITPVFIDTDGLMCFCNEVYSDGGDYGVTLIDFSNGDVHALHYISDSATGVLTFTPEP